MDSARSGKCHASLLKALSGLGLLSALLSSPVTAQGGPPIPPDPIAGQRATLVEALRRLNLEPRELSFKKSRSDEFTVDAVQRALDEPLALPRMSSGLRMASLGLLRSFDPPSALRVPVSMASLPPFPAVDREVAAAKLPIDALSLVLEKPGAALRDGFRLPGKGSEALLLLAKATASLTRAFERSWAVPLAGKERERALREIPRLYCEDSALIGKGGDCSRAAMLDALRIEWQSLAAHGLGAAKLIQEAAGILATVDPASLGPIVSVPGFGGDVRAVFDTEFGPIVFGGPGTTIYDRDCFLVIDFGGNDLYRARVGAASMLWNRPVSIAIDLGGDDLYVSGKSLDQGAALLGCGFLLDLGSGRDQYSGKDACQGAGMLGLGCLLDDGGDDVFRARGFAQGAGSFGFGVLAKKGGKDLYDAARYAQGFAGVRGFAALLDTAGNDVYRAGGVYLHKPLLNDRYQSLSQGFAIGDRYKGASGGVALLWDGGGNDSYLADVYGQGAAYWMSLGLLIDEEGNDSYYCTQYGQGAGIHLAAGALWDRSGRDNYTLVRGVGQGSAHDLAVAFLIEGAGDDYYQGSGLTQGSGNANGVGIMLELSGDDCYTGAKKGKKAAFQGYGNPARSYASVGVLLDFAGKDDFAHRGEGEAWILGQWGLTWDMGSAASSSSAKAVPAPRVRGVAQKPLPKPSDESFASLYAKARLWQVGDNIPIVANARATMIAMGLPAARWILRNKLGAAQTLDLRAIRSVVVGVGKDVLEDLRQGLLAKDPVARRNTMDLLARLSDSKSIPQLRKALESDDNAVVRRAAASALGRLAAEDALPSFDVLLRSKSIEDRRAAAAALRGIPGKGAIHRLADLLEDASFTVRDPARNSLLRRKDDAAEIGINELSQAKPRALREWLRLFAAWNVESAREALTKLSRHQDPLLREAARRCLKQLDAEKQKESEGEASRDASGKKEGKD